ncbi:unnamed protein product, partial [Thlaspi arvense]
NLLCKRTLEDDLETKPVLKKPKEISEEKETAKEQTEGSLELSETKSDQATFISVKIYDVGQVVRVRLKVTRKRIHRTVAFVEFASADEAKKALEKTKGESLLDRQIFLDVANKGGGCLPPKEIDSYFGDLFIIKFFKDVGKVVSVRLIVDQEGKRLGYGFVEFASAHEANINFFKDVGEVVHVRLMVHHKVRHVDFGFVEFASAEEAKKALEKKNGEYLHNRDVVLDVVKTSPYPLRSKYIDFPCYGDLFPSLLVLHRSQATLICSFVLGASFFMTDNFILRFYSINFFKGVGEVVGVRLIVDDEGEHVGCGFVEFASADEAMMVRGVYSNDAKYFSIHLKSIAVHKKNNRWIYVNMAEIASPYPFRPKYNLHKLAKKLWYEDSLRREGFGLENTPDLEKQQVVFCKKYFAVILCLDLQGNLTAKSKHSATFAKSSSMNPLDVGAGVPVSMITTATIELTSFLFTSKPYPYGCHLEPLRKHLQEQHSSLLQYAVQEKNGAAFYVNVPERAPSPIPIIKMIFQLIAIVMMS